MSSHCRPTHFSLLRSNCSKCLGGGCFGGLATCLRSISSPPMVLKTPLTKAQLHSLGIDMLSLRPLRHIFLPADTGDFLPKLKLNWNPIVTLSPDSYYFATKQCLQRWRRASSACQL